MNGSLLKVISPDISITSYDMQSACICACVYTVRRLFLSPASGCWWSQIAFPLVPSSHSVERKVISWSHSKGIVSWETDQESLGFCNNIDHVKWKTKCPFLRVTEGNLQGFFLQCLHGQFTMPVTSLPICLMLYFSNPRALGKGGKSCCHVPFAPA